MPPKKREDTRSISLRLPTDMLGQIRAQAAAEDRSVTKVVILALRRGLADAPAPPTPDPRQLDLLK